MPADGVDASAAVLCCDLLGHEGEGHAVEVAGRVKFDESEIPAHESGILAGDVSDIGGVGGIGPAVAVGCVVVVAEEEASGGGCGVEAGCERLDGRERISGHLFGVCFAGAAGCEETGGGEGQKIVFHKDSFYCLWGAGA